MNISPYVIPGIVNTHPTADRIISYVCDFFKQKKEDLVGPKRKVEFVNPRHIAIYLIRKQTGETYSNIGKKFNRNHTTAINAIRKINGFIEIKDFDTLKAIVTISNNLRTGN